MGASALWLPVGAVAFYLYDSLLWLFGDELVLIKGGAHWEHSAGSDWLLFRRRWYLPNPFMPQRLLWKACWSESSRGGAVTDLATVAQLGQRLQPLRVLVCTELLLVVVALPLTVAAGATPLVLLMVFGAIYLVSAIAVGWLWRKRALLGLSARHCRSLSFDALACPPFAINLVRKISLLTEIHGELLGRARPVFEPRALERLRVTLLRRVAEQLAVESRDSARHTALENYQRELMEHGA
jgi:hypothetical protein